MKIHPAILTYLNQPAGDATIMERFVELICLNRGESEVTRFNDVVPDPNSPYGRVGLNIEEAFHLTQMVNFLKGILWAVGDPDVYDQTLQLVKAEVIRKMNKRLIYEPTQAETEQFSKVHYGPKIKDVLGK